MTQAEQTEPPSWLRPPLFSVGRNSRGNWVVQDQQGICGGLFVDRDAALRFARSESGDRSQAFILVSDILELDLGRTPRAALRDEASDTDLRRRIA